MHQVGAGLLEQLLSADAGSSPGPRAACGQGHQATVVGYRREPEPTFISHTQATRVPSKSG